MRRAITFWSWLVVAGSLAVILSTLGAAPAVLSHAVPAATLIVIATSVADLIVLLTDRLNWRRASLAGTGLVSLFLMLPDIRNLLDVRMAGQPPANALTLVELNVWDGSPDPAQTIAWLRSSEADLIVLAEAREPFIGRLVHAFPDYPTMVTCADRPYCGVVILSRFPGRLLPGGWWVADGLKRPMLPDQQMSLAAVELTAPGPAGGIRHIPVIAVHLDRSGLSSVTQHQVDKLFSATVAATGGDASDLILAGDFNASPWSPQLRWFDRSMAGRAGAVRVSAFVPTWPARTVIDPAFETQPVLAIDHIYLGCGWKAFQVDVGRGVGSDHRPLIAKIGSRSVGRPSCPRGLPPVQ